MRHLPKLPLPAIAAALVITGCASSSTATTTSSTAGTQSAAQSASTSGAGPVKTASSSLGRILVDSEGMTLYHLSGEQNGRFICTSSGCLGAWHPLIAPAGAIPAGSLGGVGTVKRPEGTQQVAYHGAPLYTFAGDERPGETKGQGIKDVGTWSVVTDSSSGSAPAASDAAAPAKTSSSGPSSGYAY